MYSRCVSERSAAQQRRFEEAMLDLMKNRLAEEISISELCRHTGLSRKTFYRLYDGKADVLYAMIDHALLDAGTFEPDRKVGSGGLHKFLGYWKSRKELLNALEKNRISALLSQQSVIHIMNEAPAIAYCFGAEDSDNGRDTMIFYVTGLFSLVLDWAHRDFDRSIDEMAGLIMKLLTNPPVKRPLPVDPENIV